MMEAANEALRVILADDLAAWPVQSGACGIVTAGDVVTVGDTDEPHPWASVTKIVSSLAVLCVVVEGRLDLDEPAGPPGSTVRHLLAHASGLAFDDDRVLAPPGTRRIYSNTGIDRVVDIAVRRVGAGDPATLLVDRVLAPLGMHETSLAGSPAHGATGTLTDLLRLAAELLDPRVLPAGVVRLAAAPAYPSLAGVLPGFGRQDPNDWGLGLERRGRKQPHWMSPTAPPDAFGHFGQSGSFVWVDPLHGLAAAALTGTPFGPWAAQAWPVASQRWTRQVRGDQK